jgi:hypothetical protein
MEREKASEREIPGQSHEGHLDDRFAVLRRPYGAGGLLLAPFPTLKRGANHHCASGAMKIRTSLVNNLDSCDCPAEHSELWRTSFLKLLEFCVV